MTFGQFVANFRKSKKWTRTQMGKKVDTPSWYLKQVEVDNYPVDLETVAKWARMLHQNEEKWLEVAIQHILDTSLLSYKVSLIKKGSWGDLEIELEEETE